jgi:hypothetical protein
MLRDHPKLEDGTPDRSKVVDQFLEVPAGLPITSRGSFATYKNGESMEMC